MRLKGITPKGAALDGVLVLLLGVALFGGIPWHGRLWLKHGADLRRAALVIAGVAAWRCPALWQESLGLRAARAFWSWLETSRGRYLTIFAAFVVASGVGVLQALALRVPMYDVGIFHQIIWAVAHGHGFASSISGAGDFLRDHLSPTLALWVPLYWLFGSSPLILQVVHPALLFAGVAAWVWLAERLGRDQALAAAAALFGICFESLWGNLHWGFHENALAFAALSWAFALSVARPERRWLALGFFLVAAASKEILLVDVAFALGAWAFLELRGLRGRGGGQGGAPRSVVAASVALILAVLLVGVFVWFEGQPHPADKNYFDRYYAYLGHGLGGFAQTLLSAPWTVAQNVGSAELAKYGWRVLSPWLFLPLAAWRWDRRSLLWLFAALPSFASAALATYPPLRESEFHYVLELWPALATVALVVLARLPSQRRWALAWALFSLLCWDRDPWGDAREYWRGIQEMKRVCETMAMIPPADSVGADELTGAWLANRLEVTRWPALLPGARCPKWLVLSGADFGGLKGHCSVHSVQSAGRWILVETRTP